MCAMPNGESMRARVSKVHVLIANANKLTPSKTTKLNIEAMNSFNEFYGEN